MNNLHQSKRVYAIVKNAEPSTLLWKKMLILLLTMLMMMASFNVIACSCRPPGDLTFEEYINADLIFIGTASSVVIDKENYVRVVTFEITNPIKTDGVTTSVDVQTALDGAMCGLNISEGEKWYIWGRKLDNGIHGTGLCSRSMNIPEDTEGRNMERFDTEMAFIKDIKTKKGYQRFDMSSGSEEGKMKKGMRCGKWKIFDAAGTLVEECKYKKGVQKSCTKFTIDS